MRYPILHQYLAGLVQRADASSSLWLDASGRAQGRFFNCTMTSVFQPVRSLDSGSLLACEGLARGVSAEDEGLSLWRLLEHAASDDESVELDRLCRMLHAINFFRQAESAHADLHLNVHGRLLSAVSTNHGHAFRRILDALELPLARVVLQLPATVPQQTWLLSYVADNYRRNGFRFAVNVATADEGLALVARVRPDIVRIDARSAGNGQDGAALVRLINAAADVGGKVLFHHAERPETLTALHAVADGAAAVPLVQGYALDQPRAVLPPLGQAAAKIAA